MTELRTLLDDIAGSPAHPMPDVVAGDLTRGRKALYRRRAQAATIGLAFAGAASALGLVIVPNLASPAQRTEVVTPAAGTSSESSKPNRPDVPTSAIDATAPNLVSYAGPLNGAMLKPGLIPSGWTVGGDEFALVIAPPGAAAAVDQPFTDKILVYLEENNPKEALPTDKPIAVGGRTGYVITADKSGLQVYVKVRDGLNLRAQAPNLPGWDAEHLAQLLGAVSVLPGAQSGNG